MADTEPSARVVADPKAGSALMDLELLPLLAHFLRNEASASEAAEAGGADEPTREILFGTVMAPE